MKEVLTIKGMKTIKETSTNELRISLKSTINNYNNVVN